MPIFAKLYRMNHSSSSV